MKKALSLLLAFVLAFSLCIRLISCKDDNASNPSPESNTPAGNNNGSNENDEPESNPQPIPTVSAAEWKNAFGFFQSHNNYTVSLELTQKWVYENGTFDSECEKVTYSCTDGIQFSQSSCDYIEDGEEYSENPYVVYERNTLASFDDIDPFAVFSSLKTYSDYGFSKFEYNETTKVYSAKININNIVHSLSLKFENKKIVEYTAEREKENLDNDYVMEESVRVLIYDIDNTPKIAFPLSDIEDGFDDCLEKLLNAKSYWSADIPNKTSSEVVLELYNFLNNIDVNKVCQYTIDDSTEPQGQRSYKFDYTGSNTVFLGTSLLYDSISVNLNTLGRIYMVKIGDSLITLQY